MHKVADKGRIFLFINLAFICGIFGGSLFSFPRQAVFMAIFASLIILLITASNVVWATLVVSLTLFLFGILLGNFAWVACPQGNICEISDESITAVAVIESCRNRDQGRGECIIRDVEVGGTSFQGKLLLQGIRPSAYYPGLRILFSGIIQQGKKYSDFDYGGYLRKDGIYGIVRPKSVSFLPGISSLRGAGRIFGGLKNWLFSLRNHIERSLSKDFHGDILALVEGLLIGTTDHFKESTKDVFRRIGTYHIVAVSGSHIIMISELILPVFFLAGFPKKLAYLLTAGVLFCFVLLIGWPASAGRAWVMGSFVFMSQIAGRQRKTNNILLFTASLILLGNPLLLYDVGFQLSCASVFGLVNFSPPIERFLSLFHIRGIFMKTTAATCAAQIGTLPITLYYFNYLSLISPIANILILWIIPLLTLGGMVYLALSFLSEFLASLVIIPILLGAKYVLRVSEMLGTIPWGGMTIRHANLGMALAGILILFIISPRCPPSAS